MKKTIALIFLFGCWFIPETMAQRKALVHGVYTYEVSDNDNITLREAKEECIKWAKIKAIKDEFGEMISSDFITLDEEINGKTTSKSSEETMASVKGDWTNDTKDPEISIEYLNGKLFFTAEVWGEAVEITSAKTELECVVQKNDAGKKVPASIFNNGERIFLKFRAPLDGFLAAYLIERNNKEASCLLPYLKDTDGKFPIKGGQNYNLFDKEIDAAAQNYKLTTPHNSEVFTIVIIFSPNEFVKCNDEKRAPRHPNSIDLQNFNKWLQRCQHQDRQMVVKKYDIRVLNNQ